MPSWMQDLISNGILLLLLGVLLRSFAKSSDRRLSSIESRLDKLDRQIQLVLVDKARDEAKLEAQAAAIWRKMDTDNKRLHQTEAKADRAFELVSKIATHFGLDRRTSDQIDKL